MYTEHQFHSGSQRVNYVFIYIIFFYTFSPIRYSSNFITHPRILYFNLPSPPLRYPYFEQVNTKNKGWRAVSFVTDWCSETRISTNDLRGGRYYRPTHVRWSLYTDGRAVALPIFIIYSLIYVLDDLWHRPTQTEMVRPRRKQHESEPHIKVTKIAQGLPMTIQNSATESNNCRRYTQKSHLRTSKLQIYSYIITTE
jgi:hypothetical protein